MCIQDYRLTGSNQHISLAIPYYSYKHKIIEDKDNKFIIKINKINATPRLM